MVVVAANFLIDAESNIKAAIGGLGHTGHGTQATPDGSASTKAVTGVGHQAEGTVEDIDTKSSTVTLAHGPVPSLKWPAMSMEFKVAHSGLLKELKPGALVAFEFVERDQGEWVITAARPLGKATANPHAGHN
jgi:Cu(I)/Ag(I) efflux system membrane fusion protein/cobalt-zinc-cadmium efflux system membrane fusion protein